MQHNLQIYKQTSLILETSFITDIMKKLKTLKTLEDSRKC